MSSIFYDLETSDQYCVGQILNFAFVAVGDDWQITDQISGNIKISRLQLPRAGAILANRINVIQHQHSADLTEAQAMRQIADFFENVASSSRGIPALIGYNSSGFDLKFLRTSMIRNGVSPYRTKLIHRDLLLLSRYLTVHNPSYLKFIDVDQDNKFSLSLESLGHKFALLDGAQKHESLADVLLTINLAREYFDRYRIHIKDFEGYQVDAGLEKGQVVFRIEPDYDYASKTRIKESPYMFLAENKGCSLWVNLDRYNATDPQKSIVYRRKQCGDIQVKFEHIGKELDLKRQAALLELGHINTVNYFRPSTCDIEQDIYRVDFDAIDALSEAIWESKLKRLEQVSKKSRDARVLYLRYLINAHKWGGGDDQKIRQSFKHYVDYRYGGKLQLARFLDQKNELEENVADEVVQANHSESDRPAYELYYPNYDQMLLEVKQGADSSVSNDQELLNSLSEYYLSSEILGQLHK